MSLLERDKINRAEGYKEGFIEGFEEVAGIETITELKEISLNTNFPASETIRKPLSCIS